MIINFMSVSLFVLLSIALISGLAFWKNRTIRRPVYIIGATVLMALGMWSTIEIVGSGRPIRYETLFQNKLKILSFYHIEDKGIYLFGIPEGEDIPKYYSVPWNKDVAREISRRLGESDQRGPTIIDLNALALTNQDTPPESFMNYETPYVAPPKPTEEERMYDQ